MATLRDQPRTQSSTFALYPGARVYFYLSGTLTPAPVYAAPNLRVNSVGASVYRLDVELPNPMTSDSAARLPPIFLDPAVSYRMRMLDASGNVLHDLDPFAFFLASVPITPVDDSGRAMPGATLSLYLSRTHELLASYTASAAGVFAAIALDDTITYRVVMKAADGTLVYDVDPYPGNNASIAGGGQKDTLPIFIAGRGTSSTTSIMTSADGINWTVRATPAVGGITGLAYSPELRRVVAVGANSVLTSEDGVTWTTRTPSQVSNWLDVCWAPSLGLFCALCDSGTDNIMTSPDGITWTSRPGSPNRTWTCINWLPSAALFAAGSIGGLGVGNTEAVMTSPDGINWTIRNAAGPSVTNGFAFYRMSVGPSYFLGSSRGDFAFCKSTDGITWTSINTGLAGFACSGGGYGNGVNVGLRISFGPTTSKFMRSTNNGATWADTPVTPTGGEAVAYSVPLARWAATGGSAPGGQRAIYSADGNTWLQGATPTPADITPAGDWNCLIAALLPLP